MEPLRPSASRADATPDRTAGTYSPARGLGIAAILAATLFAPACAAPKSTQVDEATEVRVVYSQNGRTLQLWSRAVAAPSDVYSDGSLTQVKIPSDEQMSRLLRDFSSCGLLEQPSLANADGLRESIVLQREGRTWVWVQNATNPSPFVRARMAVLNTFNQVQSLHTAPDFRVEDEIQNLQRARAEQATRVKSGNQR